MARVGPHLYVVADDENHLARLDARDPAGSPLELIPFAAESLPADPKRRKAAKADLESLIVFGDAGQGAGDLLVAWGSASRPQREFAYVFDLGAGPPTAGPSLKVSLSSWCEPLRRRFGELNLEAGFVQAGQMHVFQRAHAGQPVNGHIRFDARLMRQWLCGQLTEPPGPLALADLDLGTVGGVPLGITDAAAARDGGWVFTAVAEDTADAYLDGPCVGSVIGRVDASGTVQALERLGGSPKVEGVAFAGPGRLWLVTDADDPDRPSELLELDWPS